MSEPDAATLARRLQRGEQRVAEVAEAFLGRVAGDPLAAWVAVDAAQLLAQARRLDAHTEAERARLPLFGVPVGIKDAFDTADLPTRYGSAIYAEHRPRRDAVAVARLRGAGALIGGKTACTEFSWMSATATRNPLERRRTPGGSSSGSAAAVAAFHVPLATGTQTAGSINRPASYCGVLGYKPTLGRFPRRGVKPLARTLDTVGLFARSVEDLELAAGVLSGRAPAAIEWRRAPRVAFARTPYWAQVEAPARAQIEALCSALGLPELELPASFTTLTDAQRTIQYFESAVSLEPELRRAPELLSAALREALAEGAAIGADRYAAARGVAQSAAGELNALLGGLDGLLVPSAHGAPPVGLRFTGDPLFCRAWTLIGAPCVSLPLAWSAKRVPVSLQLVGARGRDAHLLRAARDLGKGRW